MANPAHKPTEATRTKVEELASYGVNQREIARSIKVNHTTLVKHYRDELDLGSTEANAKVAKTLYNKATDPDMTGPSVTAAIFWLKTRARWKDTTDIDVTSSDGSLKAIAWKIVKAKDVEE
jgi:hypothetical protein